MPSDLDHDRLIVSPGALLTVQRTVELIPVGTHAERRAWLREHGLVRYIAGRPVVRWSDVLDALGSGNKPVEPRPRAAGSVLPRVKL